MRNQAGMNCTGDGHASAAACGLLLRGGQFATVIALLFALTALACSAVLTGLEREAVLFAVLTFGWIWLAVRRRWR